MIGTGLARAPGASRPVWLIAVAGLVLGLLLVMVPAVSAHHAGQVATVSAHIAGHTSIQLASMIGDAVPFAGTYS